MWLVLDPCNLCIKPNSVVKENIHYLTFESLTGGIMHPNLVCASN